MPGRLCSLRASYVVGPGDPFHRAAAWLARTTRGEALALPARPEHGMLYVDVRDLAEFVVCVLERGSLGPFNVTHRTTVAAWAETCRRLCGSPLAIEWSRDEPGLSAPLLEPPRAPYRQWGELSTARALAEGLALRPPRVDARRRVAGDPRRCCSARRRATGMDGAVRARDGCSEGRSSPTPSL